MQPTSGARKGRDCISKLILEVSVPVTLKQLPKSTSFSPTLPVSATMQQCLQCCTTLQVLEQGYCNIARFGSHLNRMTAGVRNSVLIQQPGCKLAAAAS